MSRLPTPGGDEGSWGSILNDFLSVEHNPDGTLKLSGTLSIKYTKPSGGIPKSDLDSSVQATLTKADNGPDSAISSPSDGQILSYDAASTKWKNTTPASSLNQTQGDARYLQQSNNLSDVADVPTSRTNLGLGTAAVKNVPAAGNASATEVVYGSDTRLSDARTPTAHEATHQTGGSDALTGNLDATARVAVAKSGTSAGSRRMVNFIPGSGIDVTTADDSANEKVDVTLATLPSNNGQMELIAEQILGADSATVTFSSIPQTYRHLKLITTCRGTNNATWATLMMQMNGDTGNNYDWQRGYFTNGSVGAGGAAAQAGLQVGEITGATAGSASSPGQVEMLISDYARTTWRKAFVSTSFYDSSDSLGGAIPEIFGGKWRNTAAITQLTFFSNGSLKVGSIFTLYGIKATAPAAGQAGAPETINIIASAPSGQSIGPGVVGDVNIPFDATIDSIQVVGDQSGSCVLDIYEASTAIAIASATSANSICGTNLPTMSNSLAYTDMSLATWNTSLTAGNWLRFVVNSSSWFTRLSISLKIRRA